MPEFLPATPQPDQTGPSYWRMELGDQLNLMGACSSAARGCKSRHCPRIDSPVRSKSGGLQKSDHNPANGRRSRIPHRRQELFQRGEFQVGIGLFLLAHGGVLEWRVIVAGEQNHVIGQRHQLLRQAVIHLLGIAAGKIDSAACVDE